MILADLEIWHSRAMAPTRRVALGASDLPCDPPPGYGGILLAGVVAAAAGSLDPEVHPDLLRLTHQLEEGQHVGQPRLRHRFQKDRVGLTRSRHVLLSVGDRIEFGIEGHGSPEQMLLGAVYAAGRLPPTARMGVMRSIRTALRWEGELGADFVARVSGLGVGHLPGAFAYRNPVAWALGVLQLERPRTATGSVHNGWSVRRGDHRAALDGERPPRAHVQAQFRKLIVSAHPDHGGDADRAAERIAELTEARRILLAT